MPNSAAEELPLRPVVIPLGNWMMGVAFWSTVILAGSARPAHCDAPLSSPTNVRTSPSVGTAAATSIFVFEQFPGQRESELLYPQKAIGLHIEGSSRIRCILDKYGYFNDCVVTSENPPGVGFGEAAIELSKDMKVRMTMKNGTPVEGQKITIPFKWQLPEASNSSQQAPSLATPSILGTVLQCNGRDPDQAIVACTALIASNKETQPGLAGTHMSLGMAYLRKQLWVQAIHEFDAALDLDPGGPRKYTLYLARGVAHNANCELDAAIDDSNRAMALQPTEATPYHNRGLAWFRKGDETRARTDFAQSHRIKPSDYPTPEVAIATAITGACPASVFTRH